MDDKFSQLLDEARTAAALGEPQTARRILEQAGKLAATDARKLHELGLAFHRLGVREQAEAAFRASLEKLPTRHAYGQLASLLEKANDLNNAWATATLGLKMFPGDPFLTLVMARCERRAGKTESARARLETLVNEVDDDPTLKAQMLFQLGWLYDREERTGEAFSAYSEGKRLAASVTRDEGIDPEIPLSFIRKMARLELSALPRHGFRMGKGGRPRGIVFVVGFPRSGTTLLNQILDSHPTLVALEEVPALLLTTRLFRQWEKPYPESLPSLGGHEVEQLREAYFRVAKNHAGLEEGQVLVDKLPLNLIHLPLALTLFPEAKVILAQRHPMGCALSCFMHNFQLNDAMVHMLTLDDITGLYAKVMDLWRKFSREGSFARHQVRYEDVVGDLEGEAKKLCRFLGVEWSPAMLEYHRHARAKGLINTPSYHQVVQPLYADSTERWRRYQKHLARYAERLAPYAERFGYRL